MNFMWLKKDIKGSCSKIVYGLKGERVVILGRQIEMIKVLTESNMMFFVKENQLSSEPIEKDPVIQTHVKNAKTKMHRL